MKVGKEEINIKGTYVWVNSVRVHDKVLVIWGKLLRIARIKEEWYENIEHPEQVINALEQVKPKPDIFTFWQRPQDPKPKYNYYMEWEDAAVLNIKSYEHWWRKQIAKEVRNKVRKARKKGVVVKLVDFNDEFVKEIVTIFNETPIRQGKLFWHYGKDFDTVKRDMLRDLERRRKSNEV